MLRRNRQLRTHPQPGTGGRGPLRQRIASVDLGGVVGALVFLSWSVTPSLLPRSWVYQGVVSGIATAVGYGLGVVVGHLVRRVSPWHPHPRTTRIARWLTAVVAPLLAATMLTSGALWQAEIHLLMGAEEPPIPSFLGTTVLAVGLGAALVRVGRAVRWLARRVSAALHRWIPRALADAIAVVLVATLLVTVIDGVLVQGALRAADTLSRAVDAALSEEDLPPRTPARTGGPGSPLAFEELGSQGRAFVTGGPSPGDLRRVRGSATEPVRVYVGLGMAEDDEERAAVAVQELERAGGFDRAVLAVVVPTGTGWINPTAIDALEYLHRGDTAAVAVQYSYLPSWLSYLVDPIRAQEAGRALFDAVHERWAALPEHGRPTLVLYGESLGGYGAEGALDGLDAVHSRTGGVLIVGPPNFSPHWRELTARRDPGSPERLPVVDGGRTVRFAATAADLARPPDPWPAPRMVYLQQASDPVVWWSLRLSVRRPDWLREPRGPDVHPDVRWYPLVTFAQLSADLLYGYAIDVDGYGHRYGTLVLDAWAAIVPPGDWGEATRAAIVEALGRPPTP